MLEVWLAVIVRALRRSGHGDPARGGELLTPNRQELNLLDDMAVHHWMKEQNPDVVVLAAATAGGIEATAAVRRTSRWRTYGSKLR